MGAKSGKSLYSQGFPCIYKNKYTHMNKSLVGINEKSNAFDLLVLT